MSRRSGFGTIDVHPDRARIELGLARGVPLRVVAEKYGVSMHAAHRHKAKLPPQLKAALAARALKPGTDLEKLRIDESEGLLQNLAAQRARLLWSQDQALEAANHSIVAQLAAQIHRNLQLVGQYLGEFLRHDVHTSVNIVLRPEYLQLRSVLMQALKPFPDARRAVSAAIHELETRAASQPMMIEGSMQEAAAVDVAAE